MVEHSIRLGPQCTAAAVEAAVAKLDQIAAPGTVITVLVAIPGETDYRILAPGHQNPAETYALVRRVLTAHDGQRRSGR